MDHLSYRIEGIEVKNFSYNPNQNITFEELELSAQYNFPVNVQTTHVGCGGIYTFFQKNEIIAQAEIMIYFKIEPKTFLSLYHGNQIILPVDFLRNIAEISLGTSRGIIWERLKDTKLSNLILPAVNINEVVNKDCYLNLSDPNCPMQDN